ncbi:hypothetical protein Bca52824_047446 [Brassica carinata]|uniref:Uncharacterized protein n=1 Tax=Brassica carinata TaxID=52824 RepID=A0A8X7RH19_BRACI|nr:hypothetical protein Bca52824_047446 [Brassica carinata]
MPGEDEFEVLVIKEFNAKDGTHRLATVDPNVMWLNEALSWMDVRKVPDEDIRWKNGEKPDFETPPGSVQDNDEYHHYKHLMHFD